MAVGAARKIQSTRSMKLIRIPVCSADAKGQVCSRLEYYIAARDALEDEPVTQPVGTLEPQELLDCAADQLWRVAQLHQRARIVEQGVQAVADEIGRRLVACIQ